MKTNMRKNWMLIGVLLISFSLLFTSPSFAPVAAPVDVTADIQFINSRLYYDRGAKQSYLDVALNNISSTHVLLSPITVVIESITPSSITVDNPDGTTAGGKPYFLYTLPSGTLSPGQTSASKTWKFTNPGQLRFTYTVSVSANIQVANHPPVANAGPDQTVFTTQTVQLNGSASSDVDGDPLTYSWSILSKPAGSAATLSNSAIVNPTFVADKFGNYTVQLIVNDGKVNSAPDAVTISTQNSAPVANAGPDQTVFTTQTVQLNGSGSTDVDGDPLTYSWLILSKPAGSAATLSNSAIVNPTFVADKFGTYIVQLIVNDGTVDSTPDAVTISTQNSAPVANAGPNQSVLVGANVFLNGSGSTDVDGDPLTYSWSFTSKPAGSTATLSNPTIVNPTFVADKHGDYVVQLIVNDGFVNSAPSTVTISTTNTPPVANAGPNQTVNVGANVFLNGSGSTDVDGDPLTYSWSFTSKPAGSTATLSDSTIVNPTFVADKHGDYVVQLIVNDGFVNSAPSTVTISTTNTPPVANAGPNQSVLVGANVFLNGSGSTDVDGDPLTYSWSFTSKPAGSAATLSNPTTVNPSFVVDKPGNYVVQLIVNDGFVNSAPSTVTISTTNTPPVANAGPNQSVSVGATVTLDGSGSTDADGNPLTYSWSFTSKPAGSSASLSNTTLVNPTFTADKHGTYVVQLIVNDGFVNSAPSTVTISTTNTPPVANAGLNQNVTAGSTVQLNGSASSDADGDPLTYFWSLITVPAGSGAVLSNSAIVNPTFGADLAGTYVAQLIVNDGFVDSAPNTVTITATAAIQVPDLTITKGHTGNFTQGQQNATYTITVTNGGNGPTSGLVTVTDTIPSGLSLVSMVGSNWTCVANSCTRSDALGAGGSYPSITLTVNVASNAPTSVANTATVSGGGETNTANDTANDPTLIGLMNVLGLTPNPLNLLTEQSGTMTVSLSSPAGVGGLTVNLSSNDTSVATVPASVTIPENQTSTPFPVTTLTLDGAPTITATATGVTGATATVNVAKRGFILVLANQLVAVGLSMNGRITLNEPAPTGGISVALASNNTGIATVSPASVDIAEGAMQGNFTVTGVAAGSATITASVAGYTTQNTGVTVTTNVINFYSMTNYSSQFVVGKDLQNANYITLNNYAPNGGLLVRVTSDNSNVLLSGSATGAGASTVDVTVQAGQTQSPVFYIQGLASSGTATLTITILTSPNPGFAPGTPLTVTLVPSGFELYCSGCGTANNVYVLNTTTQAAPTTLYIEPYSLDPNRTDYNVISNGYIRGGLTGGGLTIPLTLDNSGLGGFLDYPGQSVTTSVTIPSNAYYQYFYFDPNNTGSGGAGTIGYTPPSGAGVPVYNSQAYLQTIPLSVAATPVSFYSTTNYGTQYVVGQDLQTYNYITLGGPAPAGGLLVRVTSNNAEVVLSASATDAGGATLDLTVLAGQTQSPAFYIQGLASSGTATLTITILTSPNPGFAAGTPLTVTLVPSGFELYCSGCGVANNVYVLNTTTQAAPTLMYIYPVSLDPTRTDYNVITNGYIRGGLSGGGLTIPLTLDNSGLGGFLDYSNQNPITSVTIPSNGYYQYFYFDPNNTGSGGAGTIGYTPPSGAGVPVYNGTAYLQTIPLSVAATPVTFNNATNYGTQYAVGKDLQTYNYITLGGPAPAGGLLVRVTSDNAEVVLSASATDAGAATVDLTVPVGQTQSPAFYIQGLASSGTATLTITILTSPNPGFAVGTPLTVTLVPSGFELYCAGGCGFANNVYTLNTTTQAAPTTLYIEPVSLDPTRTDNNVISYGYIRGGLSGGGLTIPLTLDNSGLGGFLDYSNQNPITSVTIPSNGYYQYFYFDPSNAGSGGAGTIGYTPPSGAGVPVNNSQAYLQTIPVAVTLTPVTFYYTTNYGSQFVVGKDLQNANYITLGGPAPAGGLQVRVTSNNAEVVLSATDTGAGAATLDLTVPAGQTQSPAFYIQGLASSGTATLTITILTSPNPGFTPGTPLTVTLVPSGFLLYCASGGCGFANNIYTLSTTTQASPSLLYVYVYSLDPTRTDYNLITNGYIRGGLSGGGLSIPLTLDNASLGGFLDYPGQNPITSVTIPINSYYQYFYFDPNNAGSGGTGTIGYTAPLGSLVPRYNNADYLQTIYLTVTP